MSSSLNSHTPAVTQQHHISNSNQWHVHRKGQQLQERRCCISSWLPAADSSRSAAAEGSTAEESSPLTLHPRSESPEWDTQVRGRPAGRLFQISPTWSWNSSTFSPDSEGCHTCSRLVQTGLFWIWSLPSECRWEQIQDPSVRRWSTGAQRAPPAGRTEPAAAAPHAPHTYATLQKVERQKGFTKTNDCLFSTDTVTIIGLISLHFHGYYI